MKLSFVIEKIFQVCLATGFISLFIPAWAVETHTSGGREIFDAAPFANQSFSGDNCDYVLRWNEARDIRCVEVEFESELSASELSNISIGYWHRNWKGLADPPASEVDPAGDGWLRADDWSNGKWKTADTRMEKNGATVSFVFAPSNETEFPNLQNPGVTFRKTLKIRLHGKASLPKIKTARAFTDSVMQSLSVRINWDDSLLKKLAFEGEEQIRFEAYNGRIIAVRPLDGLFVKVDGNQAIIAPGMRGGVELQIAATLETSDAAPDCTVITVWSKQRPFSFAPNELLQGRKILIADLGVLVTKGDDATSIAEWRATLKELGRKTVYDRVTEANEQTLAKAWKDMPLKQPLYFVHGVPGNRNVVRQDANGNVTLGLSRQRLGWQPGERDSKRLLWEGSKLRFGFGFPENRNGERDLLDGYLPELRTHWQEGPLHYEQTTVLGKLHGDINKCVLDDPTVLWMRVRVVNTSDTESGNASLLLNAKAGAGGREWERMDIEGERVSGEHGGRRHFRYLFQTAGAGKTVKSGHDLRWTKPLQPGESHNLYFAIPTITLSEESEIAALASRKFDNEHRAIVNFWRGLDMQTAQTTRITTPEPWLNDFYKAHARHLEINCLADIDQKLSRRYAVVGSFTYGVYPNESAMMISDLDRRGMHKAAEDCLQTLLDFQGSARIEGNFQSPKGLYYGAGGLEVGNYNKNHGYVLWALAEHWKFTRDCSWMERVAPSILAACEWIINERKATMKLNADGTKPLEYGFLPAGALEDVRDYWFWQATNTATVWGFDAVVQAMSEYKHPEAKRLQAEAKDFHADVMRGLTEARILAPVARLRDGTYVPRYTSHLHLRGRAIGWIRETLEGAVFLPAYRLLDGSAPETAWIMKDYEDNLYISSRYGYSIPTFEQNWFSRGGFSMQANLLDGPLPYLYRDDIKHYIRAFFNGFASGFYPETKMLNEHAKPELGYPFGDHFKTSDEAQVTYWLRLMFVREDGDNLYLGQAIPRYWLKDGNEIGIQNAASYFGPMSLAYHSAFKAEKQIIVEFSPPVRNQPKTIYLRLRHPEHKPIKKVTINGMRWDSFDAEKEWIMLPGNLKSHQTIIVSY